MKKSIAIIAILLGTRLAIAQSVEFSIGAAASLPEPQLRQYKMSGINILKMDVDYITNFNLVYGASVGIKPWKQKIFLADIGPIGIPPQNGLATLFLGYKIVNHVIVGITGGFTHVSGYISAKDTLNVHRGIFPHTKTEFIPSIGASIKYVVYTKMPIIIGAFISNAGLGFTIGTAISKRKKMGVE